MTVRLHRYTSTPEDVEQVVAPLLAVYAKVREPLLHLPNYTVPAFAERLGRHGREPGFGAVLAFDAEGGPVGYAYGNTVESGDRWWKRMGDKVRRVYESWGYEAIGTSRPSPESPVLTAMIRPTGVSA